MMFMAPVVLAMFVVVVVVVVCGGGDDATQDVVVVSFVPHVFAESRAGRGRDRRASLRANYQVD